MTVIRGFELDDLEFARRQTSREGWAASRDEFNLYLEHDPDGCFVALAGDQPVGMVTTTCFGASGWISNLIVEPAHRGRGIGRILMEHGLDRLRDRGTTTVRLDGDPPGIPLYRKLGFVDEYESCRFTLSGPVTRLTLDESAAEAMSNCDLHELAALDASIAGAHRKRFLGLKRSTAEFAVIRRRNGRVVASLMAAPTDRGFRIGPCVALDPADARCLIAAAISATDHRPVLVGLPALNTHGLDMLAAMGFEPTPPSYRMRLGPPVDTGDPTRVFAISSGAVG